MTEDNRRAGLLTVLDDIERILHDRAERPGTAEEEQAYARLRRHLIADEQVRARLPDLVLSSPNLSTVWGFLREYKKWHERREFASRVLEPARAWLEGRADGDDHHGSARLPDSRTVLHTVRTLLEAEGQTSVASLLVGLSARLSLRGNDGTLHLLVPIERITEFGSSERQCIADAARRVLRSTVPWHLACVEVDPLLETPPDESEPLPGPTWKPQRLIQHDGLWFRSKTEIRVYEALKMRSVFFFVNATGVLGGKSSPQGGTALKEPDFVICLDGRWGILEVMGEDFHTSQTAPKDHDRARLFKEYGVRLIEFYDAHRCYHSAEDVVDEFLRLLAKA